MSKRKDSAVIQDIVEAMNRIVSYTSMMDFEQFTQDYKTQDAVITNIEILGEGAK